MKKILVYHDKGAIPFCVTSLVSALQQEHIDSTHEICFANRALIQTTGWQKETKLLVFPGGADIPYHQALKGLGNQYIADYVKQGGNYLGICAGGYYGSSFIEFEQGGPLEVIAERELKFFPGIARGPAYGLGKFCYQTQRGAQISQLIPNEKIKITH